MFPSVKYFTISFHQEATILNRIDRLTAMIIFLQGHKHVTVEEMVERYNISERTVYRDLKALQEAGVPIGSEPAKGYFIVKGYHLPPVMFSKEEAAALLTGERLMQQWQGSSLSDSYQSSLDKIRAVLSGQEKEYLDVLDEHIKAFPYTETSNAPHDREIFNFLQESIFKREVITIDYYSPYQDKITQRDIESLGLLLRGTKWYLAAWCRFRENYRMFRVDRIKSHRRTGIILNEPLAHTLKDFYETNLKSEEKEIQKVVVRFSHEMFRYLGDQKYHYGWVSQEEVDDGKELTFLTYSIEYIARWLLSWGKDIQIKEPQILINRVQELSAELYQHYNK